MQSFRQFLRERNWADLDAKPNTWTRIPDVDMKLAQREPHVNLDDELYALIAQTYAYVGGYPDFKRSSDIPGNHTVWYGIDLDRDTQPDAVIFGKSTGAGEKLTGGASDGSPEAKRALVARFVDKLRTKGIYAETSDALMHLLLVRYNVHSVDHQKEVERVLGKSVTWLGPHPQGLYPGHNGFYTRELFGTTHMKILLGSPK